MSPHTAGPKHLDNDLTNEDMIAVFKGHLEPGSDMIAAFFIDPALERSEALANARLFVMGDDFVNFVRAAKTTMADHLIAFPQEGTPITVLLEAAESLLARYEQRDVEHIRANPPFTEGDD